MLRVAHSGKFVILEQQLIALGAKPGVWNKQTNQLSLSVPVECLEKLVELDGVVYFEKATSYSR